MNEAKLFIFECSTDTYLTCIEKGVFGSNKPWPLRIKRGDFCMLHHYEVGRVFALWRANTDGGRNLVPRLWGGKFPYQAKVLLVTERMVDLSKEAIAPTGVDPATGRFENDVETNLANQLLKSLLPSASSIRSPK